MRGGVGSFFGRAANFRVVPIGSKSLHPVRWLCVKPAALCYRAGRREGGRTLVIAVTQAFDCPPVHTGSHLGGNGSITLS